MATYIKTGDETVTTATKRNGLWRAGSESKRFYGTEGALEVLWIPPEDNGRAT